MKRRTKTRTKFISIHVSIPVTLLDELDETLGYKQSRSRLISNLIDNSLTDNHIAIANMTKKEIVVNLINQTDPESSEFVLLNSLLQIFSK